MSDRGAAVGQDPARVRVEVAALVARARAAQREIDGCDQARADELAVAAAWAIVEPTRNRALAEVPGVICVEEVYAHRFGPYLVMNVTVGIDGSLSVAAGDSIACAVEQQLYDKIDLLRRVHVHYHPEGVQQLPETGSPKIVSDVD